MKNLKELRKQRKLSQQDLAEHLHVSQQSIYKYENGLSTPDLEILSSMADLFNCSIDYLVGHSSIPHKIEPVTETSLNEDELHILKHYRALSQGNKKLVTNLIVELAANK